MFVVILKIIYMSLIGYSITALCIMIASVLIDVKDCRSISVETVYSILPVVIIECDISETYPAAYGVTIGMIVLLDKTKVDTTLVHEITHVKQNWRGLIVFGPLLSCISNNYCIRNEYEAFKAEGLNDSTIINILARYYYTNMTEKEILTIVR